MRTANAAVPSREALRLAKRMEQMPWLATGGSSNFFVLGRRVDYEGQCMQLVSSLHDASHFFWVRANHECGKRTAHPSGTEAV